MNESAAVGALRKINSLENLYATAHPSKGFACELPLLGPQVKSDDPYDSTAALLAGKWSGYKFAIVACSGGADGVTANYEITAIPTEPRTNGVRAFCSDQSGLIFFDLDGSASECIRLRKQLSF